MGNCLKKENKRDAFIKTNNLENINPKNIRDFPWQEEYVECYVYKVYDGDTVKVLLNYQGLIFKFSIRIFGIDTPEVSRCSTLEKQAGIKVKHYLKTLIENKTVKIYCICHDKYGGRIVGDIYYMNDNEEINIADELLKKNYAKIYDGKTSKEEWKNEELVFILSH